MYTHMFDINSSVRISRSLWSNFSWSQLWWLEHFRTEYFNINIKITYLEIVVRKLMLIAICAFMLLFTFKKY